MKIRFSAIELISILDIFLHLWQKIGIFEYNEKLFFKFLIFFEFGPFRVILSQKLPKFRFLANFAQNDLKNGPKSKNIKKSKKQVLFISQNAIFLPKMKEFGQNGDEFYCLEANSQTPQMPGFPIHLAKFRFVASYLGTTTISFNFVKSS